MSRVGEMLTFKREPEHEEVLLELVSSSPPWAEIELAIGKTNANELAGKNPEELLLTTVRCSRELDDGWRLQFRFLVSTNNWNKIWNPAANDYQYIKNMNGTHNCIYESHDFSLLLRSAVVLNEAST
jgi:hypothetical protein